MNLSTIELVRDNLFTNESELNKKHTPMDVERIMKARSLYMWRLSNPEAKDRQFIEEFKRRYPESGKSVAYEYLMVVNRLLPMLSEKAKDFHRWRYNEMILETYQLAKEKGDAKTMEKAATSYGKLNRIDAEDIPVIPYHLLMVQPFMATNDPRVLGIEPIADIDKKITAMIEKYSKETMDIDEVDFEEVDLEEDELFAPYNDEN